MRLRLVALVFFAFLALDANAGAGREVTLTLPHALRSGETAWLEVEVGAIERGEEIDIVTTSGRSLGSSRLSGFGQASRPVHTLFRSPPTQSRMAVYRCACRSISTATRNARPRRRK